MYLVLIAWFYVAFMMAVAEAMSPVGSVLGAIFTFLLYGALPMAVVGYILGTPARRRALKAQAQAQQAQTRASPSSDLAPDGSREAAGDTVTSVRKEL